MALPDRRADDPRLGLVLGGQFRLDALLGEGATARVYRARQVGVERDVAVKILRREHLGSADVLERFLREARVAGGLVHPGLIALHVTGELPANGVDRGEPFTVFELARGRSLAELVGERGALPWRQAGELILRVSQAVGHAHARGVVHRDIKPENVLIETRGTEPPEVKLLDFGLAKSVRADPSARTRDGAVLGTPRFVSPEGAQGEEVGPPGDCYALAALLYHCLSGHTPFEGAGAVTLLVAHATLEPPNLRSWPAAREVPEALSRFVMQNLAKAPESRAADGREFAQALSRALRESGAAELPAAAFETPPADPLGPTPTRELGSVPDAPQAPPGAPSARRTLESRRAARKILFVVACLLLGGAVALGIATGLDRLGNDALGGAAR